MMGFKEIPATSVSTYISGLHSLNLDLEDGTGFDWHFTNYWKGGNIPIKLYGEGKEINTNHIFGYYGVANREERLRSLGLNIRRVYIANHHRAIVDMVYEYLTKYNQIGYAKGCVDDYFFNEKDAVSLFRQLIKMSNYLDSDKGEILYGWLSKEFRIIYKSWQLGTLQEGKNIPDEPHFEEDSQFHPW